MSRRNLFRRAVAAMQAGRLGDVEALCSAMLQARRDDFDALHMLGLVESRRRRPAQAMSYFDRALLARPDDADAHNNRGTALTELGRLPEALIAYDRAVELQPDLASAHNNRGCVLMALERFEDALASHSKALVLSPDNADYMNNLGRALTRLKRYDDALDCYDDAIRQKPDFVEALVNRGATLQELDCFEDAAAAYLQAIEAGGEETDLLLRRAGVLNGALRHADALDAYERVIRACPDRPEFLLPHSATLAKLKRIDEAFAGFDRALSLGVDRADVHINRAFVLNELGRQEEALDESVQAVALRPDHADAQNAHGMMLMALQRFDAAISAFKRAVALRPVFPVVEWNLGYLSLLRGDFAEGWRRAEARRRQDGTRWTRLDGPEWRGEPLAGTRILVYAEQGLGDVIHFARYASLLARMGATVILGVYAPLAALLRNVEGDPEIAVHGAQTPLYHCHAPLMSIPSILGHSVEADIPAAPYLRPEADRVVAWRPRLPEAAFKVGIAWQGSAAIPGRSIPLADFAPLARISGVGLISLQKSDGLDQLEGLPPDLEVQTLGAEFDAGADAFLDTAAVMTSLDLIVTCDTAIAHLAGGLGRPVWIVLKTVPDWRWMLERLDSPWYPSARLFRRGETESWEATMQRVGTALAAHLAAIAQH